jgi:hypothetical protein
MKFKFFVEKIVPIITATFLLAFFIWMAVKYNKIIVPGAILGSLVSLYIFYEYNRVKRGKKEERREYLNERRQELLDNVLKKNKYSEGKDD